MYMQERNLWMQLNIGLNPFSKHFFFIVLNKKTKSDT